MVTPHLPWKFHSNRSSRFRVMLLTKKERKRYRSSPYQGWVNIGKATMQPQCGIGPSFSVPAYSTLWLLVLHLQTIIRASSIQWHTDFHAAPWNSPFAMEFAACHGKMRNCPFFASFVSNTNSRFFGLLFNFTVYKTFIITSNVPGPRPGTFTPAQRPGRYRGCSVLRYLRPRNLAASFAAATGTAGVMAALCRSQSACCGCARSANQRLRWWPTLLHEDQHYLHYITIVSYGSALSPIHQSLT